MTVLCEIEALRYNLEALPEILSLEEIEVEDNIIKYISFKTITIGGVTVHQLGKDDAQGLFEFYNEGLSEKPRWMFAPYPLFQTPPSSPDELAYRIANWKNENDWAALVLVKDTQIIGFALLKRFRTEQVTSAIVVRDEFLKRKIGYLLLKMTIEQACLLGLKKFHVKIVSDNLASIRLHEKCGFKKTRVLQPPIYEEILEYLCDIDKKIGNEPVDRSIVELVIDLDHCI